MSRTRRLKVTAQLLWYAYKPKLVERLGRAPWERRK